jgi:Zn-dependent metalloprotease
VSSCHGTLQVDTALRARRQAAGRDAGSPPTAGEGPWEIHTASNGSTLPGELVRSSDQPESGDAAVDEAATGSVATLDLYSQTLSRSSFDDQGSPVVVTVHYETDYDNAFWDGKQLVFGDGDHKVFDRFTKPVDVLGHEFTHGVTQFTAALAYEGQSGALNESISDVFGVLVKQRLLGQSAADADWLIGEGIFLPAVQGSALRSMKDPGSAYDDDVLGKDPQVASMDDYVDTTDDNGGVHINSGIPNKAFYLAASALGGNAWDQAGPIWYAALTGGSVTAATDFAGFAQATVAAAAQVSGAGSPAVDAVSQAWSQVGVEPGTATSPGAAPGAGPAGSVVQVRRSGGFAGQKRSGQVSLDDPRGIELASLLQRIDVSAVAASPSRPTQPDRFVYVFVIGGREVTVQEQDLTDDLRRLAGLVLDDRG